MLRFLPLAILLAASTAVRAEPAAPVSGAAASHAAWHDCLRQAYALRSALSGSELAADAALRNCRDAESAYLAALSTSPLLDADDVTRVRPALVIKARAWLTGRGAKPSIEARL